MDGVPNPIQMTSAVNHLPQTPSQKQQQERCATSPTYSCFVCQGCDRVLCTSADVLTSRVPGGVDSTHAFPYALPYLLDLDEATETWCYVCSDDVTTVTTVPQPPSLAAAAPSSVDGNLVVRSEDSRRMDLVRVRSTVATGLLLSVPPPASCSPPPSARSAEGQDTTTEGPPPSSSLSSSSSIIVQQQQVQWSLHPAHSWFQRYQHQEVLQCPDCLATLGWLFHPRRGGGGGGGPPQDDGEEGERRNNNNNSALLTVAEDRVVTATALDSDVPPSAQSEETPTMEHNNHQDHQDDDVGLERTMPSFCGLILQRIRQRDDVSLQDVLAQSCRCCVQRRHFESGALLPNSFLQQNQERVDHLVADRLRIALQQLRGLEQIISLQTEHNTLMEQRLEIADRLVKAYGERDDLQWRLMAMSGMAAFVLGFVTAVKVFS